MWISVRVQQNLAVSLHRTRLFLLKYPRSHSVWHGLDSRAKSVSSALRVSGDWDEYFEYPSTRPARALEYLWLILAGYVLRRVYRENALRLLEVANRNTVGREQKDD